MDQLVILKEDGFSMIEALVGITILGILFTITIELFGVIYKKPEMLLEREALHLATQELNRSISGNILNDTTYTNRSGNLILKKTISETESEDLKLIQVSVFFKLNQKILISLSTFKNI